MVTAARHSSPTARISFRRSISFAPLIEAWRGIAHEGTHPMTAYAKDLVARCDSIPRLSQPSDDRSVFDGYDEIIQELGTLLFSPGSCGGQLGALIPPYEMNPFYCTPAFEQLVAQVHKLKEHGQEMQEGMLHHTYATILERLYNIDLGTMNSPLLTLPDPNGGGDRVYEIDVDLGFVTIHRTTAPETLDAKTRKRLVEAGWTLDVLTECLPPEGFHIEGVSVFRAVDVTDRQRLLSLKLLLLEEDIFNSNDQLKRMRTLLQAHTRIPELNVFVAVIHDGTVMVRSHTNAKVSGQCIYETSVRLSEKAISEAITMKAIQGGDPVILFDIQESMSLNELGMFSSDDHAAAFIPITDNDQPIGLLGLLSPQKGSITPFHLHSLEELQSYLNLGVKRSIDELENRLQNHIQQTFTAIHPAVEWRFKKEAYAWLEGKPSGQIQFDGVHPLYHQSDIRNSSHFRNEAIQNDLAQHLDLVTALLDQAFGLEPLPILAELKYRTSNLRARLADGLSVGDELGTLQFIQNEVEPSLDSLSVHHSSLKKSFKEYHGKINPQHRTIYDKRKAFDDSVSELNTKLSEYVQSLQGEAQRAFPHYFSLNTSDGVDVTMYIGQSMDNSGRYSPLYVQNLRLWQFLVLVCTARLSHQVSQGLPLPLQTTHLLIVQDLPISLRYDLSQRDFAVSGAYNIRYEIIKKRIDKALIRGTKDRLTQPDTISLVYSQSSEAAVYRQYGQYLAQLGLLGQEPEELELEELQGISGLKALRWPVVFSDEPPPSSLLGLIQGAVKP